MPQKRPNFIVFCTDQMQSACLGCNGNERIRTPNIEALAAGGTTFRRAYVNNPVCQPSRASMLTGKTPRQHGLITNGCCLSESVPTLTGALGEAGYRTHAVGKFHLQPFGGGGLPEDAHSWEEGAAWNEGTIDELPKPYYGFQDVDFVGGHIDYVFGHYRRWLQKNHPDAVSRLQQSEAYQREGRAWRMDLPAELHYNNWIADRAIDFLRDRDGNQPFFLFCSFPDPHFPYAACRPYSEMYDPSDMPLPETWRETTDPCESLRRTREGMSQHNIEDEAELREITAQTYGMITHVDENIGRVLGSLGERDLGQDTVVMLMADHGEYLGSHGLLHKGPWPWEELWRVPFVWRLPDGQRAGRAVDDPVSLLDFAPTISEMARLPEDRHDQRGAGEGARPGLPGRSLQPFLTSRERADHPPPIVEYDEDWHGDTPLCRLRGIVDGDWKLVTWAGFEEGVLINLAEDPLEERNLWNDPSARERKAELLARLAQRLAYTDRFDTRRICGA
jgi:arylsulfatase A-like enzyme